MISLTTEAGGDLLIHEVQANCEFGHVVALVSAANPLRLEGRYGATNHVRSELVGMIVRNDLHPSLVVTAAGGLVFYGEGSCGWVFARDGLNVLGGTEALTYANIFKITAGQLELLTFTVFKALTGHFAPLEIEFNM